MELAGGCMLEEDRPNEQTERKETVAVIVMGISPTLWIIPARPRAV